MDSVDFKNLEYFSEKEITSLGCDPEEINYILMLRLDILRRKLGCPIKITSLTNGKHATKSLHYPKNTKSGLCEAVDFKVLKPKAKQKVLQTMIDVGFRGIGVYSWGFHGDIRKNCALWQYANGVYLPLV